jgi:hypothetical protein
LAGTELGVEVGAEAGAPPFTVPDTAPFGAAAQPESRAIVETNIKTLDTNFFLIFSSSSDMIVFETNIS